MLRMLDFFKCLSDDTRLKMILLLYQNGELCVCELENAIEISQPKASRHLSLLKQHNIVEDRRQGLWVYYRLNILLPDWAKAIIASADSAQCNKEYLSSCMSRLHSIENSFESCES